MRERDKFDQPDALHPATESDFGAVWTPKVSPNGEVARMIIPKPSRILLTLAALGSATQFADAGCNCGVPPAPAMSASVPMAAQWSGTPVYANSPGSISSSAYGMMPPAFGTAPPAYGTGPQTYGTAPQNYPATGDLPGPNWAPGGYEARVGSPAYYYDPAGGQYVVTGDPYYDHFGPGFQRNSLHGHYRFPYYNYRAPWYYPGKAVYNRNTNFAW